MSAEPVRLQKFLAAAGVASRRKAEELIVAGRVKVNDAVVKELGTKVDPEREPIAGLVDELKDERLRAELESKRAEGDAALDELEKAIAAADEKTRAAEAALEPKKDEPPPEPGAGQP